MEEEMDGEQPTKKTSLHNFISAYTSLTLVAWSSSAVSAPDSSLDHFSDIEPALSFRCQTNGFATVYKGVVMFEPGS